MCISSLTAQTYPNLEIILVDDGSPDNCPAICDEFAAKYPNIRVIHQENKGLSGARNTGIAAAKGELLTFVDSDDSIQPVLLERLYRLMEESGADVTSAGAGKGKPAGGILTPEQAIKCLLKENTTLNTSAWGKLFKAELFNDTHFPEGLVFEDYATIPLLFSKANKIAHTDEALYNYRVDNQNSITKARFNSAHMQYFTVSDSIDKFLKENYPKLCRYARNRKIRFAVSYFKKAAQSGGCETEYQRTLINIIRKGILPYLFSGYKLTGKAYGILIAVCPALALRLFAG